MGLDALYSQLFHQPKKLAIIGAGCSGATEPTAEVSHYYNITQVGKTLLIILLPLLLLLLLCVCVCVSVLLKTMSLWFADVLCVLVTCVEQQKSIPTLLPAPCLVKEDCIRVLRSDQRI